MPQNQLPAVQAKVAELINHHQHLLIMQADMPDGDSLGSALALEEILADQGKQVSLYSYNPPPEHLRYLEGWDRVQQQPPKQFDLVVLVDASGAEMLQATLDHYGPNLSKRPWLVIDHHAPGLEFPAATTALIDQTAAATAEVLVRLALALDWTISPPAASKLAAAILSDSLGLTTPNTSLSTLQALTELVRQGASLSRLNDQRRQFSALTPEQIAYKGRLLSEINYRCDGRLATVVIAPENSRQSKEHNPTSLIMAELHWIKGVELAAVLKDYGTKTKVILRSHQPIAAAIAKRFGGGGHDHAASYRTDNQTIAQTTADLIKAFEEQAGN